MDQDELIKITKIAQYYFLRRTRNYQNAKDFSQWVALQVIEQNLNQVNMKILYVDYIRILCGRTGRRIEENYDSNRALIEQNPNMIDTSFEDIDDSIDKQIIFDAAERTLNSMTLSERSCIKMYLNGMMIKDIAKFLGITKRTVFARVIKFKRMVKEQKISN